MEGTGMTITNFNDVIKHMLKLDLSHKVNIRQTRAALKIPFNKMKSDAKSNLASQGSLGKNRNLYRGLSVGSRISRTKGYMTVAFGARSKKVNENKKYKGKTNHFHLVNSGTSNRWTNTLRFTGAVGKSKTSYKGKNKSFRLGFADKAIKPILPTIRGVYISEFNRILNGIKTPNT